MRKDDFFEILGELDDDIVKGAKTTMKKKLNWKVWGTMAVCLCLIVAGTTALLQQNSSTVEFRFPVLAALLELMLETAMG